MGILVAKRYRTTLVLGLADHTYVECHSGSKGWSCWGGKTGGTQLRVAAGSTGRADLIAGKDERAGITCYAINGVCHQSANRILFPANATVRGARGYKVSEAIYGPYGRFRGPFGTCHAPFNQHPGVVDDLPECRLAASERMTMEGDPERRYLEEALHIYESFGALKYPELSDDDLIRLHVQLFMLMVDYAFGEAGDIARKELERIRADEERARLKIERAFTQKELRLGVFVEALNDLTIRFQESIAKVVASQDYTSLLGLIPGDFVVLVDPGIAREAYPGR